MTPSRGRPASSRAFSAAVIAATLVCLGVLTASTVVPARGFSRATSRAAATSNASSLIQHSTKKELSAELSLFFALFRQTPPHTQVPVAKSTKPVPPVTATRSTATTSAVAGVHVASASATTSAEQAWVNSGPVRCIRHAESTDRYFVVDYPYSGAYQDRDSTWHSISGLPGTAADYPPAVQDWWNYELYLKDGWGQWSTAPGCGV